MPGTTNGDQAIRGAYLVNGATLSGFTVTKGATRSDENGGGVLCEQTALVSNCALVGNSAARGGGGVCSGILRNCAIYWNWALAGGGAIGGNGTSVLLTNCTISGNRAAEHSGGIQQAEMKNCICYFNTAPDRPNHDNPYGRIDYSCTTPLPTFGPHEGNISVDPQLSGPSHLSVSSPCRNAGSQAFVAGIDIDGEVWGATPSMGCDEYVNGAATGSLAASFDLKYTNFATGYRLDLIADVQGQTTASVWEFGDGSTATNQPYTSHAWATPGEYPLVLRAFNDGHPSGVSITQFVRVVMPPTHYVSIDSTNPTPPYSSWTTAARTIQEAVDAAALPGAIVLVTNGVYNSGGRAVSGALTNRVAVDKPLVVRSINGPEATIIQGHRLAGTTNGDEAIRCVYLSAGAQLSGFKLENGATRVNGDTPERCGGGVFSESTDTAISNCIISGNAAADSGGGAYAGTLDECVLRDNTSGPWGGGANGGILNRCTVLRNSAGKGGGAAFCSLSRCILSSNTANAWGGGAEGGGAEACFLENCLITDNTAAFSAGASASILNNCTVVSNRAEWQYGGTSGAANNCIIYYNAAAFDPTSANHDHSSLNYCCTTPAEGVLNITNPPQFMDLAHGDLRLSPTSPCINGGKNAYVTNLADLGGSARISGGAVDIGAYEFQNPSSIISYAWLQGFGLPIDGTADWADPDFDGMNNWQEWICGTVPTNGLSLLRLLSPRRDSAGVQLIWQSETNRTYTLERSTNLALLATFTPLASGIMGQPGTTTLVDTNATGAVRFYYRVRADFQ